MSPLKSVYVLCDTIGNPYFSEQSEKNKENWTSDYTRPMEINDVLKLTNKLGLKSKVVSDACKLYELKDEICFPDSLLLNLGRGVGNGIEKKLYPISVCSHLSIPYAGSSAYSLCLNRNKFHCNAIARACNIPSPASQLVNIGEEFELSSQLTFPIIVKPNSESNSIGIDDNSIFNSIDGLETRIKWVHDTFKQEAVLENYICGDEISVSVIGNNSSSYITGTALNLVNGQSVENSIITRKNNSNREISTTAVNNPLLEKLLIKYAIIAHEALHAKDYSRVDFRLDNSGNPYFIELEPQPDLGLDSKFIPAALRALQLPEKVIGAILETAHKRISQNNNYLSMEACYDE